MQAIGAKRQRRDPEGAGRIKAGIEMGEESTAPGGLPLHILSKGLAVEGGQQQVTLPGEMLRSRLPHLRGGGEMDVAIGNIDGSTIEAAPVLRIFPKAARQYLENLRHAGPLVSFDGAAKEALLHSLRRNLVREFALDNQPAPQDQPPIHLHQEYLPISMGFKGIYS